MIERSERWTLSATTPQPLPWTSDSTPADPLALTEAKASARYIEAQAADRRRFWSWAEVRNILSSWRNRG